MRGHTVMGEQGVQEGAEHAPLWGPCVEDQQSGGVVSYLHLLGVARQEVQEPVAQGGVQTQVPELNDELGVYRLIDFLLVASLDRILLMINKLNANISICAATVPPTGPSHPQWEQEGSEQAHGSGPEGDERQG